MNDLSFTEYLHRHARGGPPEADRVVPLVASAGAGGVSRRELGKAVRLAPGPLDALLDALVRAGMLTAAGAAHNPVYHARLALAGGYGATPSF